MLTRDEMKAVIANGGSVLHGGRIISREADLPTEAALAAGDPAAEADVAARLQGQVEELQAQLAKLQAQAEEPPPLDPNAGAPPPAEKPAARAKKAEA